MGFLAHLIAAIVATFGTASFAHAEILIGMAEPLTGPNAWIGEQTERGVTLAAGWSVRMNWRGSPFRGRGAVHLVMILEPAIGLSDAAVASGRGAKVA
jgi:hypothetical protein